VEGRSDERPPQFGKVDAGQCEDDVDHVHGGEAVEDGDGERVALSGGEPHAVGGQDEQAERADQAGLEEPVQPDVVCDEEDAGPAVEGVGAADVVAAEGGGELTAVLEEVREVRAALVGSDAADG